MEYTALKSKLANDYVLFTKGRLWSFIGGSFAFLIAIGVVSYQSSLAAVKDTAAKTATAKILEYEEISKASSEATETVLENARKVVSTLTSPEYVAGWTLVYEHDETGKKVKGSLEDLKKLIRGGADIKVSHFDEPSNSESFALCEWTFIAEGVVSCMNTAHVSIRKLYGENFGFQKDAYHWYVLLGTEGKRDMSRWSVGENKSRNHNQVRVGLKWFARRM